MSWNTAVNMGAGSRSGAMVDTKDVVRIRVTLIERASRGKQSTSRRFSIDPQLTTYHTLRHIITTAFGLAEDFIVSYMVPDQTGATMPAATPNSEYIQSNGSGEMRYLPMLSEWDFQTAVYGASSPELVLKVDVKDETHCLADWDVIDDDDLIEKDHQQAEEISQAAQQRVQRTLAQQLVATGSGFADRVANTLPKLLPPVEAIAGASGENARSTSRPDLKRRLPPLSDAEFRSLLDGQGRLLSQEKLRLLVYMKGVEPSLRPVVWRHLLDVYPANMTGDSRISYTRRLGELYTAQKLCWQARLRGGRATDALRLVANAVRKDVVRTDRAHPFFAGDEDANPHLLALFNMLTTFALCHPDVGYCQGMSDLAAPLLYVLRGDEAQAYITFCALMRRLKHNFSCDNRAMTKKFQHLSELLQFYDPVFHEYLKETHADDLLFAYRWLLLELKREFTFDECLRVLEVMWASLAPLPPMEQLELFDVDLTACDEMPFSPTLAHLPPSTRALRMLRRATESADRQHQQMGIRESSEEHCEEDKQRPCSSLQSCVGSEKSGAGGDQRSPSDELYESCANEALRSTECVFHFSEPEHAGCEVECTAEGSASSKSHERRLSSTRTLTCPEDQELQHQLQLATCVKGNMVNYCALDGDDEATPVAGCPLDRLANMTSPTIVMSDECCTSGNNCTAEKSDSQQQQQPNGQENYRKLSKMVPCSARAPLSMVQSCPGNLNGLCHASVVRKLMLQTRKDQRADDGLIESESGIVENPKFMRSPGKRRNTEGEPAFCVGSYNGRIRGTDLEGDTGGLLCASGSGGRATPPTSSSGYSETTGDSHSNRSTAPSPVPWGELYATMVGREIRPSAECSVSDDMNENKDEGKTDKNAVRSCSPQTSIKRPNTAQSVLSNLVQPVESSSPVPVAVEANYASPEGTPATNKDLTLNDIYDLCVGQVTLGGTVGVSSAASSALRSRNTSGDPSALSSAQQGSPLRRGSIDSKQAGGRVSDSVAGYVSGHAGPPKNGGTAAAKSRHASSGLHTQAGDSGYSGQGTVASATKTYHGRNDDEPQSALTSSSKGSDTHLQGRNNALKHPQPNSIASAPLGLVNSGAAAPLTETQPRSRGKISKCTCGNCEKEFIMAVSTDLVDIVSEPECSASCGVLPPPNELGYGNPFLMFVCLTLLLEHRDKIIRHRMEFNEIAIYFDKLARQHRAHRVLRRARKLYADYLRSEWFYKPPPQKCNSNSNADRAFI